MSIVPSSTFLAERMTLSADPPYNGILTVEKKMPRRIGVALTGIVIAFAIAPGASAQTVESFYKGKRLTMIVGSAVGGGYDAYARLVSRHLGRFIPGGPTFVVQNMPGAGGAVAAGHLYNVAAKDGTVVKLFQREILVAPLLESRNIDNRYDARRFNWLGSLNSETGVIVVRSTTQHKTFEDLLTRELLVGSSGPSTDFLTIWMNRALKTKMKIVTGYRSSTEVYLAMERGEMEGRVSNGWSGDKGIVAPWVRDGKARLLVALALKPSKELPDLPLITKYVNDTTDRQVMELILVGGLWGRPFATAPDVPKDRVAALRKAFIAMTNDGAFTAEAKKLDLDLDPIDGAQIEEIMTRTYASPQHVIEAARAAISGN
jgi:tripartite-type tricarboxylate transporter receptor subunit TctC